MGTTVEKATKAIQSISKIQQGINNLGGSLTNQTPLDEFKSELDNIYAKFPKTEYQEGSNITLSNCLKGKLDYEDDKVGYGDIKQDSTNGYQLFDINGTTTGTIDKYNNGFKLTKANNRTLRISLPKVYSAGTYTLSLKQVSHISSITNYFYLNIQKREVGSGYLSVLDGVIINNSTQVQIQIPGEFDTLYFFIANGETDSAEVTVDNVMLESGTTAHTWEKYTGGLPAPNPSYKEDIEVVRGKNIFDKDNVITGYYYNINGVLLTSQNWNVEQVEVQPNTNYYLSGNNYNNVIAGIVLLDKDKNFISLVEGYKNVHLITTTATTKYIGLSIANYSDNSDMDTLQLEKGSQATSYLPYNTLEVKARGKNHLLCRTDIPIGYTRTDNGITWQRTGENTFKLNGTASGDFTLIIGTATPLMEYLKTGETYTLSGCPSGGSDSTYRLQIFNFNGLNSAFDTGNGATFVANISNTSNVAIRVFNGTSVNNLEFNTQIELGSTKTSFIPFEVTTQQLSLGDIELAKIGTYRDYIYRTYGKNLLDTSYFENGSIDVTTGQDITSATNGRGENYIPVLPNTQYTISTSKAVRNLRLSEYTSEKVNIQRDVADNATTLTITTTANTYFVRWSLNYNNTDYVDQTVINSLNLMLELGSTATDYHPFGSGKWYVHKLIQKKIFDGTESWTLSNSGTPNYSYRVGFDGSCIAGYGISNYFINRSIISASDTVEGLCFVYASTTRMQVRIRYGIEDTIENFQNWLSTHNIISYYVLATPTDTEITDTLLINQLEEWYNIQSVNGTTIIEINGNLPMIIKCRALKGE